MKLLLSFSNIKNLKDFDLVVANSNVRCKETDFFHINSFKINEKEISSFYEKFIDDLSFKIPKLKQISIACNNNLYTNLLSLFKWKSAIDELVSSKNISEIVISDLINHEHYTPYYEAEGEAHFKLLYRDFDFIPIALKKYIEETYPDISIKIIKKRSASFLLLRIFLRRHILLCAKLIVYLFSYMFFTIFFKKDKKVSSAENLIITRSVAHFEAIKNLCSKLDNSEIFCGEGLFTIFNNYKATLNSEFNSKSFFQYLSLSDILKIFFKTFRLLSFCRSKKFQYMGISFSYQSCLKEMVITYFEVDVMNKALKNYLKSQNIKKIFICEMYTPYAFENANLARSLNIKSFQLQTTNMFSTYEPNFIHADLFLFNNKSLAENYEDIYPERKSYVKYLGNFSEIEPARSKVNRNIKNIMYFTQPKTDEDLEQDIIRELIRIKKNHGFNLYIKLHPRDSSEKLKDFSKDIYVIDRNQDFEFYEKYVDIAVLKTSSIATKLVFQNIPVIYCLFSDWARNGKLEYIDHNYSGTITNIEELEHLFQKKEKLFEDFILYRDQYISNNGLNLGVVNFIKRIREI